MTSSDDIATRVYYLGLVLYRLKIVPYDDMWGDEPFDDFCYYLGQYWELKIEVYD